MTSARLTVNLLVHTFELPFGVGILLKRFVGRAIIATTLFALIAPGTASGQGLRLLRDAEIEDTVRTYATPLFVTAGLQPDAVDIILVNDRALNAFVAGGQRLFMNAGLLMRADTPNQVIGVIAHEVGHIAGGHLVRSQEALQRATTQQIISILAGLAAAVASGRSDVGVGVLGGGQDAALRTLLQYSRQQESAADQAGVRFLERTGQSSRGLLEFFRILGGQELLLTVSQDPYLRTHPLTRERVSFLESHVATSRFSDYRDTAENLRRHARMRAKFQGFLDPNGAFRDYPSNDQSEAARYARAIAYFQTSDLASALRELDTLLDEYPDDPYYNELRGQILFENGRLIDALPSYQYATSLAPTQPLIRLYLARTQVELNDPTLLDDAISNLREVVRRERDNPLAWRTLAVAYGRQQRLGESALANAEYGLSIGDAPFAREQAQRAQQYFNPGDAVWLRAQDIIEAADKRRK